MATILPEQDKSVLSTSMSIFDYDDPEKQPCAVAQCILAEISGATVKRFPFSFSCFDFFSIR
jgi:hypothetical protein